jgi:Tol biopolymer transport system component/DNA-binding winged helix-turn-helix (wHTH) protein
LNVAARYYSFGPFVLDRTRGILFVQGSPVPTTPRVLELLSALVERPGETLHKDELLKRVWGDTCVEENNLARQICTLRKVLHERPGQHEYIATVAGSGYRFVAEVTAGDALPVQALEAAPALALPAAAPGWRKSVWRVSIVGLAAAIVAAAALVGWRLASPHSTSAPSRPLWQFSFGSGLHQDPSWSPAGDRIAFASDRTGNLEIWTQGLADPQPTQITFSSASNTEPAWSPDGQLLAFRSERDGGGLYVIPAAGGTARRLSEFGSRPRWSPSGNMILFSNASTETAGAVRIYLVSARGGAPRLLQDDRLADINIISAAWHPDGRVSVWGRDLRAQPVFVTVVSEGGPAVRSEFDPSVRAQLDATGVALSNFIWAPSAHYLYFEGRSQSVRNLWRVAINPTTLQWTGGPERLTTGPGRDAGLVLSADGSRLAFSVTSSESGIWSFPFNSQIGKITGPGEAMTSGDPDERAADAWLDGRKLVYLSARNDRQELWERLSGEGSQLLLSDASWNHTPPRWSPDGTRIAYQRSRRATSGTTTERAVVVLAVDTREEQLVTSASENDLIPADWSSDGRALITACRMNRGDRLGTCVLPMSGADAEDRRVRRISADDRVDMVQQRYSPNQQWISFSAIPAADRSIATVYVMPASGGVWTPVTDGQWYDDKPRWAPDGRTIYFISNRDGRANVWARHIDPVAGQPLGALFRVTNFDEGRRVLSPFLGQLELCVSANRIFLPMYQASGQVWVLDHVDR